MHPFEVMAEPVRRRMVEILASGEHTAGEVAAAITHEFRISRTAVSKHARILRDAGFIDIKADLQWRWYHLTEGGLEVLEDAVAELRSRMNGGVGKDPFGRGRRDPLHGLAPARRKGPGRPPRRGTRGHQTTAHVASQPDLGLYPVPPPL